MKLLLITKQSMKRIQYHKAVNEIDTGDNISNQIKCNAQQKFSRKRGDCSNKTMEKKHLYLYCSSALKILIRNSNLVYEKSNELFLKLQK